MIVREYYSTLEDETKLFRTFSDSGYKIRQIETGVVYDEAIDIENALYTYEETDELKEIEEEEDDRL